MIDTFVTDHSILIGVIALALVIAIIIVPISSWILHRTFYPEWFDPSIRRRLRIPLILFLWMVLIRFSYEVSLSIYGFTDSIVVRSAFSISHFFIVAWAFVIFSRLLARFFISRKKQDKQWKTNIHGLEKLALATAIIVFIVFALNSFGYNVSSFLAAGGIAGIAIGLASRDMLANMFGGLFLYLDKPFAVGDWVRSDDREIEGTIEKIGIRQTMVRKFNSRPLYVPNAVFGNIVIENPSRMSNRLITERFGLRYKDAHVAKSIIDDIRQWLIENPEIDNTRTLMVYLDSFNASSLDCCVYTSTVTTNWETFHRIKQEVLLKVLEIIKEHGADCPFPTQTLDIPEPASTQQAAIEDDEAAVLMRTIGKKTPLRK